MSKLHEHCVLTFPKIQDHKKAYERHHQRHNLLCLAICLDIFSSDGCVVTDIVACFAYSVTILCCPALGFIAAKVTEDLRPGRPTSFNFDYLQ